MRTKNKRNRETDAENRKRALVALQKAKDYEKKKGLVPLRIHDEDNTILMVSPKLTERQKQKLKDKMLQRLSKRHTIIEE
ncbi:hypothetical protein LJC00_03845 [Dysgonomonas sp. OttesenSCG-928-M03]|nr:hypothetical protein [Dysgonomonas sp. OttesenSCG-928-M03]